MVRVHIPALLQDLTGQALVQVETSPGETLTVGQLLDRLDRQFPGLRERLLYEGDLMPGIAVFIDNEQGLLKLLEKVQPESVVHFLPPIVGG